MKYEPKPHQEIALEFLREHKRAALFLDMGLGKTVVTLTRIQELIDDFAVERVLVIAPKRVAEDTWTREVEKWDHTRSLTVCKLMGTAAQRKKALATPAQIYIINRENVQWLITELKGVWPYDMVVIDELSSFKSPQAKRWRTLKRVIKQSTYVIGLTGTPAPNGYIDLWPQMYLIDGGDALGYTLTEYRNRYFIPGARKGHVVYEWLLKLGSKTAIDIRLRVSCLSRSKEDWLKLPPLTYNEVRVRMTTAERKVYDQFMQDKVLPLLKGELSKMTDMDSAVVGGNAAVLSGKLLQMASGTVYDDTGAVFHLHDQKLDALKELEEAAQGQPILIFYGYKHELQKIMEKFPQARKLDTPKDIADWNSGQIPMLLCHPASAGHGLNLQTGGNIIVWYSLPWSLELYSQANARLYRQGQEKPVIIHHLVCDRTIDEKVLRVLQKKDSTQRELLNALKGELNEAANYERAL